MLELTSGQRLHVPLVEGLVQGLEQQHVQLNNTQQEGQVHSASTTAADDSSQAQLPTPTESTIQDSDGDGDGGLVEASAQWLNMFHLAGTDQHDTDSANGVDGGNGVDRSAVRKQYDQLVTAVGSLLRSGVNSSACTPVLWGVLGRWYHLQGQLDSAKEAWLKQVRNPWYGGAAAMHGTMELHSHACRCNTPCLNVAICSVPLMQCCVYDFR